MNDPERRIPIQVSREADDPIALRASIGGPPEIGFYLKFRGDPDHVLVMLRVVMEAAEKALPEYAKRQGPRG